jgi:DNA polymerase-3 subunit delta'
MPIPSEIIGHTLQIDALKKDLAADNVVHAYLFAGPRHLGKFTVAKWFARELLTADSTDEDDRERRMHQIDRLLLQDLLVIDQLWMEDVCEDFDVIALSSNVPQLHRKKAGAKTDVIGIDDIRALQDRMHEVGGSRFRCCLIRSVERMQDEAVNALLKILEEPPPGVVFLLTTQSLPTLLPTLVSRSRVLRFSPLPLQDLLPLAQDLPGTDAQFLLRVSQGAPGVILRLKRDPDQMREERKQYAQSLAFWHASTLAERLKLLEPLAQRTEEAQGLLLHLSLALREEKPEAYADKARALLQMIRDIKTNASRPLLIQRFAFAVSAE